MQYLGFLSWGFILPYPKMTECLFEWVLVDLALPKPQALLSKALYQPLEVWTFYNAAFLVELSVALTKSQREKVTAAPTQSNTISSPPSTGTAKAESR